jgi:hypothetical protein
VDEERIQLLCDLFFVGELECAFERNPDQVSNVMGNAAIEILTRHPSNAWGQS